MSANGPAGPYIYQPYGTIRGTNAAAPERLYGIGGIRGATIVGLLKSEAQAILRALETLDAGPPQE